MIPFTDLPLPPLPRFGVGEPFKSILSDPLLFERINKELDKRIMGEEKARKCIFLVTCGRLVINCSPTSSNLLVNDESGKGKDHITDSVLDLWRAPKSEIVQHKIRISPTVFTYWNNADINPLWTWDDKIVYLEDLSAGVLNSDAFKTMASSKKGQFNSSVIVGKDLIVKEVQQKGKPVVIVTMAESVPIMELLRRFPILSLESDENHIYEVMRFESKRKSTGITQNYDVDLVYALGILKPVNVIVPFSALLAEYFKKETSHYYMTFFKRICDFISFSAALHQQQRVIDSSGYVLAQKEDYEIAKDAILALSTNKSSIGLTRNQKELLTIMEKYTTSRKVNDILSDFPRCTKRNIYNILENLRMYGLVREVTIDDQILHRDVSTFELIKNEKFSLPTWEELNSQ